MTNSVADNVDRLGRVQSLVRALSILDELGSSNSLALSDISSLVKLPKSTTHRLLTTMEALDYVQFDRKSCHWSVGFGAFRVGSAFTGSSDLEKIGSRVMRSLVLDVNHSVSLSIPQGNAMYYLKQLETRGGWPTVAKAGASLPMYSTASGKCIMACWSEGELEAFFAKRELVQRTSRTIDNRDALRKELSLVLERGYAIDDQEQADGTRCVAAVVTDRAGRPGAALSISDSATRLKRARFGDIGHLVAGAAQRMSNQITSYM